MSIISIGMYNWHDSLRTYFNQIVINQLLLKANKWTYTVNIDYSFVNWWISNHSHSLIWDVITHQCSNFNGHSIKVIEWVSTGYCSSVFNSLRSRQNGPIFHRTFSNGFSWMKMYAFRLKLHGNPFPKVQSTIFIGLDNGLAPVRLQAIIWTNDGLVYWRIYAFLGLNEFICCNTYICPNPDVSFSYSLLKEGSPIVPFFRGTPLV